SAVGLLGENSQHVLFAKDHVLRAVDLHVGAAVLADQDAIALLDVHVDALAFLGEAARAHGHDLALLRLLLGRVGTDDPAANRLLCLDTPDQNAVGKRPDVHGDSSST